MSRKLPTKVKLIRHTFRKDRSPKNEPEPAALRIAPKPPTGLPREGRRLWIRLAPELVNVGVLTVADLEALEAMCTLYGMFREARQAVYRYREFVRDADGKVIGRGPWKKRSLAEYLEGQNSQTTPELVTMRQSVALMKGLMAEFGLTPASRSRIDLAPAESPVKSVTKQMMDGER